MLKKMKLIALLTLIMSILIGCQAKKEEAKKESKESTEITLMIPDWGAPTEEMLAEFKAETGISVKVLPTAWDDTKNKISIAAAGKKAVADVVEVDWSWVGEFQSAGWLEPLEVDDATQKDIPSISYFKVKDKIYAVPYANGLRLAYINDEMLSKAGIKRVNEAWNGIDGIEETFDKLKKSKVVDYPMLFPLNAEEKTTTSFLTLAYTRNGKIFNDDDTLNKESALDALQLIKKFIDKGYINPSSVSTPGIDTFRGINNAQGAFLIGPTSFITSSNDPKVSKVVGKITTIPVPGKDGAAKQTITFTEAVGVSAYSQNKEAAKKFVEWFSRPETQLKLNKAINNTPTRTSVIEQMVKEGIIKTPGSIVEQSKIVASPFPNGVPKYYTKMSTEIFNIINQLGQGKLPPEEAANKMEEKVNELAKQNK
ncbi:ABC transporter substrate-binding protein [Pseudoleptotrichia goodfellowii]|uniref:ABC transporter, solute-binding protein n=1 Tax=Pseudoleptotrichia goodfellowii TaxID=157692 RepID=A0A510J9E7_9FUSO|nr:sugar ABC transporter substrate-binding protein [Pseudoleptotrichia goodfellowii]BBM35928.1 ABC transporter, solute-binding protein [Pseudoleptotrichia goodfellowii]